MTKRVLRVAYTNCTLHGGDVFNSASAIKGTPACEQIDATCLNEITATFLVKASDSAGITVLFGRCNGSVKKILKIADTASIA